MAQAASFDPLPGLRGTVAVVTGGGGSICGEIACALARAGGSVAVWDIVSEAAAARADAINRAGGRAVAVECDATDRASVREAARRTTSALGDVGILVNGAGGSRKETTTSEALEFFDIEPGAMAGVIALNYMSAVIPSQEIGRRFAAAGKGVVLNVASVAGLLPLSRAVTYSNGKAALASFTQWLAVHMAKSYSPAIRVNAIAPGFVVTDQNQFLLVDDASGDPTERGKSIIEAVPMRRYGEPREMAGAALWLLSDTAAFVTGVVVPVDGGFSAFSGV